MITGLADALMHVMRNMGATPEQVKPLAEYISRSIRLTDEEFEALKDEGKIHAIRLLRARTGISLRTAYDIINSAAKRYWPLNECERNWIMAGRIDEAVEHLTHEYGLCLSVASWLVGEAL